MQYIYILYIYIYIYYLFITAQLQAEDPANDVRGDIIIMLILSHSRDDPTR